MRLRFDDFTHFKIVQSVAADRRLPLRPALVREHPKRLDPFRLGSDPPSQSVQIGTNRPPVSVFDVLCLVVFVSFARQIDQAEAWGGQACVMIE